MIKIIHSSIFFVSEQTYKISKGSNNYCSHCILVDSCTAFESVVVVSQHEDQRTVNVIGLKKWANLNKSIRNIAKNVSSQSSRARCTHGNGKNCKHGCTFK